MSIKLTHLNGAATDGAATGVYVESQLPVRPKVRVDHARIVHHAQVHRPTHDTVGVSEASEVSDFLSAIKLFAHVWLLMHSFEACFTRLARHLEAQELRGVYLQSRQRQASDGVYFKLAAKRRNLAWASERFIMVI